MLHGSLYRASNIGRIGSAFVAGMSIMALICGYFLARTGLEYRQLRGMERELAALQSSAVARSAQLREAQQKVSELPLSHRGGMDLFALRVSGWAHARNVNLESLTPEGQPSTSEIQFEDKSIGQWTSNRVGMQGRGQFGQVMGLIQVMRISGLPVRIESFSLESLDGGMAGDVEFNLVLTIYERAGEAA